MNDRLAILIRYFLEKVPGAGRTRIIKFLYLIDHDARQFLGRPISQLQYIRHKKGPYSYEFDRQLKQMEIAGDVTAEQFAYQGSAGYSYHVAEPLDAEPFAPEEKVILDYVADLVKKSSLNELLDDIVYQTAPMVEAVKQRKPLGQPLNMALVDNIQRIPGLELERMLRSLDNVDKGNVRPLDELFAELSI
jgi:hypothetical protein